MAKLFLSYSRKDAAIAQRFTQWLTREGHHVWRDEDDIGGGASFSSEIEKALKDCAAVLVLWSADSVQSSWVRDEAGCGRDLGKLIPFSIDGTEPPLGFRQFQSIDLSRWKRSDQPPAAERIRSAIERVGGMPVATARPPSKPRKSVATLVFAAAAIVLLMAAALATLLFWPNLVREQGITIAVMASPTSPDRATAVDYANIAAADMAAFLPTHFDRATVIPPSDATARTSGNRMLISVNPHEPGTDASLTLSDSDGHTILWSKSWSVPDASAIDLREIISRSASQAALCLTEAKGGKERLAQPALGQFMGGCVGIGDSRQSDAELLATFERVVKLAPDFPRGWAYLAIGRSVLAAGKGAPDPAMKSAREAIATARKLNPRSGLAYLAESLLVPNDRAQVLALLNQGAELEPDSALLQTQLTDALRSFGRMGDSVQAAKRAVELDPLSSYVRSNYIAALTYAGQFSRAQADIAEARKKWPNDPDLDSADFGFQYRYGDPRTAEKLMPNVLNYSDARLEPFRKIIAARLDPSPAKIDDAIRSWDERSKGDNRNQYLLALGEFQRVDETYALLNDPRFQPSIDPNLLFRPEFASVRADVRFIPLAARLGLVRYWRDSGNWPDFCNNEQLRYDCKTEAAKYR
jgi:tetratricopeptide (TPR) repeat protein